jgi:site-specific DNA-cytosine methylase
MITMSFKAGQSEAAGGVFVTKEFAPTLQGQNNGSTAVPAVLTYDAIPLQNPTVLAFAQNQVGEVRSDDVIGTIGTNANASGRSTPMVLTFDARGNGEGVGDNTLSGDHQNRVTDYTAIVLRNREGKPGGGKGPLLSPEKSLTLGTSNDQVLFTHTDELAPTLGARDFKGPGSYRNGALQGSAVVAGTPRRLTPMECERLMGWPDGWTDVPDEKGKPAPDTARYKACGNGVASPVAAWIGFRLREALEAGDA